MSVVIVGGHDRMVCRYKKICKEHNCKAKVFTQMSARLSEQIGSPDLLILFTNTVSHKMVKCAITEAEKCNADIVRCHTSSGTALNEILTNGMHGINIRFYNNIHLLFGLNYIILKHSCSDIAVCKAAGSNISLL